MFVIASNRPWHREMAQQLSQKTGRPFVLIDQVEQLNVDHLKSLGAETVFLPHWSHMIPAVIFDTFECIVFHMTDLPYGRGGSPLQNLIVRGHESTMISALRCVTALDAGPIYLKQPLCLHGSAQEIFLRASLIIQDMIVEIIEKRPTPQAQSGEGATFKRRTPAQGNWANATTLKEVYDYIRMLDAEDYPPAFIEIGGFRLEFTRATLRDGKVVADVQITQSDKDAN